MHIRYQLHAEIDVKRDDNISRPIHSGSQMKNAALILAACLGFLGSPFSLHAADMPQGSTLFVYKLDGTKHCEATVGESLDSMANELTGAGIEILSSKKRL